MLKNSEIYDNDFLLDNEKNQASSQIYEFENIINSQVKDIDANSSEYQSNELNCFTTNQLAKIQRENFTAMKKGMYEHFDNELESAVCDNCQMIGKKDLFIGNFCCKVCKEKYTHKYLSFLKRLKKIRFKN